MWNRKKIAKLKAELEKKNKEIEKLNNALSKFQRQRDEKGRFVSKK